MAPISYSGYRFPRDVIHRAVWMYIRFTLSFRDVENLLAERGIVVSYETIVVSYETIRRWVASLVTTSEEPLSIQRKITLSVGS
jgi:putative transposase